MTTAAWIGVVPTVLGVAVTAFAASSAVVQRRRERSGRQVDAQVVDHVLERRIGKGAGTVNYYPVFEFVPEGGSPVRGKSAFGSAPASHQIGDIVPIWYDPADPRRADIRGEGRLLHVLLGGLGLLFAAVGLALVLFA